MPGPVSDAELGAKILAGWERMSRAVADGPRFNRRLAQHLGIGLRDVEHVRDTRNRVAHPGEAISRHDLERAVSIIRRAKRRTKHTTGPKRRARPRRPARSRNAVRAGKPRPRKLVVVAACLVVVVSVLIVLWTVV